MNMFTRAKAQLKLTALTLLAVVGFSPKDVVSLKKIRSRYVPHQGVQEMARRRRQIESGMLRAANGLDIASYRRLHGKA